MERTQTLGALAADVIRDFKLLSSGVAEMAKSEATYQSKVAVRRLGLAVFGGLLAVHGFVAVLYALATVLVTRNFPDARMYAVASILALAIAGVSFWLAARKPAAKTRAHTPAARLDSRAVGADAAPVV